MVGQNVGKYKILDRIGRGGMGTVYRAIDETLHRDVAIKVLNAELNDPEVAKRFRAEAITVARLSHPGIATIYELFEYQGEWLMVMEFVRGETLENMVTRMGPLSAQRAAELCMQTLAALAHAHSMGVVHRDLKPANVMITESGAVKVMDFGIARVSGSEHLTNAGFMMGTPAYMAPEQVRGGEVDARADLYAMGVVFYRLTTSKLPFKGDTAFSMVQSQVNDLPTPALSFRHDLPAWVDEVVTRALEKAPEERFQSAAEFHEAFARCLAGLPLSSMYIGGDPMMTPSRAMPSGAFARGSMAQPTPFPGMTGPQATTTGSHPTMRSPGTHPGVIVGAGDPTMLTPTATPAVTASQPLPPAGPVPAAAAPKRSNLPLILGLAGLVVIGGSLGAWALLQSGGNDAATPPPPTSDAQTPSPPPAATDQAAAGIPSATTVPAPPVAPTGPATVQPTGTAIPAPAASPVASSVPRGARAGATPTPTPTTTPSAAAVTGAAAAPPVAAASDPLATFPSVKFYEVDSKKRVTDRDVLLNFSGGQVSVMPKSGGEAIAVLSYKKILKATYTAARDPKWDTSLLGPPADLDVGTFMRQTRHWLVVQGSERYAVLRLDDNNFRQILETFEARTGLKIERPK